MNISKLARELKTEPQILRQKLPELGIHIGARAIQIDDSLIEKARDAWKIHQRREELRKKLAEKPKKKNKKSTKKNQKEEKIIAIPPFITVSDFAKKLNLEVPKLIVKLMQEGIMAAMHQKIDYDTAHIIAEDLGFKTQLSPEQNISQLKEKKSKLQEILKQEKNLEPRPPVVVVMGHVDHGKTTLLDYIRKTTVAEKEVGAITQHIGAYQTSVKLADEKKEKLITFIDTPGHQAFSSMRSRGGQIADIAVLVIAADDKIQPQTLESIEIIQKEKLGLVVAINKIDLPNADVEKIKTQLAELNLQPEDWGGKTICVPISAKSGKNVNELLENIVLLSEIHELKASKKGKFFGTIIESHIDKGLGPVATVVVQNGTLQKGDLVKCSNTGGKIKSLQDFTGKTITKALPAAPIKVLGLKKVAKAGDLIKKAKNLKEIRKIIKKKNFSINKNQAKSKKKKKNILKIFLKADVAGSLEALIHEINKIKHPEAEIKIIKQGLGNFTENDVLEAEAENAKLIAFNVVAGTQAKHLINSRNVKYQSYQIIYKLLEELKKDLEKTIPPKIIEKSLGQAKVLKIFSKTHNYQIIGGQVKKGKIKNECKVRIFRKKQIMAEGAMLELQTNKQKVQSVRVPQEFGAKIKTEIQIKPEDELKFYITKKKKKKL